MTKPTEQDIKQLKRIRNKAKKLNAIGVRFIGSFYRLRLSQDESDYSRCFDLGEHEDKSIYIERSLSDINTIIEQAERIAELTARVEELEEENQVLTDLLKSTQKRSEQHDLEMQAKGIEDALNHICGNGKTKPYLKDRLLRRAEKLRNQAKGGDLC